MIYSEVLSRAAEALRKRAAALVVPPPDGTPPPPTFAPAASKTPYWRAKHEQGRLTALATTVDDLRAAVQATGLEPHHETLLGAIRGAASLQGMAAENAALPAAERGQRRSRSATLSEIATVCEEVVAAYRHPGGGRPRTYRLMAPEAQAAFLWKSVAEYFRAEAEGGSDPQRVGSRRTLYQRTREEYYYLRGLVPALPDLRDLVVTETAQVAAAELRLAGAPMPAPERRPEDLRSPAQEAAQQAAQELSATIGLAPAAAAPAAQSPAPARPAPSAPAPRPVALTGTAAELAARQAARAAEVEVSVVSEGSLLAFGGRSRLRSLTTGRPLPPAATAALQAEAVLPADVVLVRLGGAVNYVCWQPEGGAAGWFWADAAGAGEIAELRAQTRGELLELE